ncbi:hypothetical protein Ae201684P_003860 [Aphanomyces euteiches]|uniref:PDZ domain-containing protein n=1 Tax=Aphanomyces euteiches TaxID=100861 RepID=A0A6G0XT99_9STRA|nr:hypothetical protein Ae201684_001480 [Aphanomyces euteiches]KAH9075176.1 hypothetical protein Ae201684P_003860 [Aphanomyces euteiches]
MPRGFRHTFDESIVGRVSNLLCYPFKKEIPKPFHHTRQKNDDEQLPPRRRHSLPDSFRSYSNVDRDDDNEIPLLPRVVSFRDGSRIVVPPSHTSSSSAHSRKKWTILTTKWHGKKLGLLLENIGNCTIVKQVTDDADFDTNPDLRILQSGDQLVSINEESAILMGFDASVDRILSVKKPAMLQFRRRVVHQEVPRQPMENPFISYNAANDTYLGSIGDTFLMAPSAAAVDTKWSVVSSAPLLASAVSDIDSARQRLGKSEIYPLGSTERHKVCTMIKWAGEPLGIALQKNDDGEMEIKFCTGDGLAATYDCLAPGDILVSVGGVPVQSFALSTCLDFLQAAQKPVALLFRRHVGTNAEAAEPLPVPQDASVDAIVDVVRTTWTRENAEDPWRLGLQALHDKTLVVLLVTALPTERDGDVHVGDRLVAIHDVPVAQLGVDAALQWLKRATTVQLTFAHSKHDWMV